MKGKSIALVKSSQVWTPKLPCDFTTSFIYSPVNVLIPIGHVYENLRFLTSDSL